MSCISKGTIKSRKSTATTKTKQKFGNSLYAESPNIKKKPLVFIDVNLGKEKGKQKLTIYKNDDPKVVAEKFSKEHCNFIFINLSQNLEQPKPLCQKKC